MCTAVAKRFLQAHAGQADGVDDQRAFIETGDEFRPKPEAEHRRPDCQGGDQAEG